MTSQQSKEKEWKLPSKIKMLTESGIRFLYVDRGMSVADIAELYQCSEAAVRNKINKLGIPLRGRKY